MKPVIYRYLSLLAYAGFVTLLTSCAHYQVDFYLTNDEYRPKGKTIAVMSGTKENHNLVIVSMVTDALRKSSRFQVTSQQSIAQAVQPYPQNIKGPYKSAYFQIDTDWTLCDRQKIAQIHRSLGVDYLYVIWAPIAVTSSGSNISQVPAVAQLFELATGKEVARTVISLYWGGDKNQFIKDGVVEIAAQLADKTGMSIVAKPN